MSSAFIKLHISIFLAGFTGILGKLIQLPEGPLVWYRLFITLVLFSLYLSCTGKIPRLPVKEALKICAIGAVVTLHWIFFYGSIKYANVSICVVCFSATGFFTAIFEPFWYKKPPSLRKLLFSLLVVAGIALIFHFDTQYRVGIILGLLAAAFAAVFTILLKQAEKKHVPNTLLFYQLAGGLGFLTLAAPLYLALFPSTSYIPGMTDILWLFILSSACTIGMFLLQIQALHTLSAFTVNLSFNLEPIYSIIMAILFLGEGKEMNNAFFVGLALICISVAGQSVYAALRRDES